MTGPRPLVDQIVRQEIGRAAGLARNRLIAALSNPRFIEDAWLRYEQGQVEYGHRYEWLDWSDATFEGETHVELLDSVIYPAMQEAARILRENWRA